MVVAAAQPIVRPIRPRLTTSMRSSITSWKLFMKRPPSVRKPRAVQRALVTALRQAVGGDLLDEEAIEGEIAVE